MRVSDTKCRSMEKNGINSNFISFDAHSTDLIYRLFFGRSQRKPKFLWEKSEQKSFSKRKNRMSQRKDVNEAMKINCCVCFDVFHLFCFCFIFFFAPLLVYPSSSALRFFLFLVFLFLRYIHRHRVSGCCVFTIYYSVNEIKQQISETRPNKFSHFLSSIFSFNIFIWA